MAKENDEEFQVVLNQADYNNYLSEKTKFKEYEKLVGQISENNEQLEIELRSLKKSFSMKKAQVEYLKKTMKDFLDKCNGAEEVKVEEDQIEDVYENLVETNNSKGMSSIETYEMTNKFDSTYREFKMELSLMADTLLMSKEVTLGLAKKRSSQKSNVKLKQVEQEVCELENTVEVLREQKTAIQRENVKLKNKVNNLEITIGEYEAKRSKEGKSKEEKSYVIKLLVDEYRRELYQKLTEMKLTSEEVNEIIFSELQGISDYIQSLNVQKEKSKRKGLNKKKY